MGTAVGRLSELADRVGDEKLTGRVVFDQIYARYQHERLDLRHPAGGEAKYLSNAIYSLRGVMMQRLANAVNRGELVQAMVDNMEDVAAEASARAPFEFGDLKASHNPQVRDNRRLVYDRPPPRTRLTREELRIKSHLRGIGFGNRG